MTRCLLLWVIVAGLSLSACGPGATPTTRPTPDATVTASSTKAVSATVPPTARSAALVELRRDVQARSSDQASWLAAAVGERLSVGGGARTGPEARARLDISDGTIMRLGASTVFELAALSPAETDPVTRLTLDAGKVWVQVTKLLSGGAFDVETPSGLAGVRGSLMSVEYYPADGHLIVTCLEGQCRLTAANGQVVNLQAGQQAEVPGLGKAPTAPQPIDAAQLRDWAAEFPEARGLVAVVTPGPPPTATPTIMPSPSPTAPTASIAAVGSWSGVTSQGYRLSFAVSPTWQVTSLHINIPRGALSCQPNGPLAWAAEYPDAPIRDNALDSRKSAGFAFSGVFNSPKSASGTFSIATQRIVFSNGTTVTCTPPATASGTWTATGP